MKRRTKDRKNNYQCYENLNLILNLPEGNSFWARFTDHDLKLHYDHANALSLGWLGPWNLYGSFSSTRKLKNSSFKFGGIRHFGNDGSIDLRMRFNIGDHRHEEYLYMKSQWKFGAISIATIEVIDLYRKFLQKNDVAVSYEINKQHSISGLLESEGFRNYQINYWRFGNYFDLLRLGYLYSQNKLTFGLEVRGFICSTTTASSKAKQKRSNSPSNISQKRPADGPRSNSTALCKRESPLNGVSTND